MEALITLFTKQVYSLINQILFLLLKREMINNHLLFLFEMPSIKCDTMGFMNFGKRKTIVATVKPKQSIQKTTRAGNRPFAHHHNQPLPRHLLGTPPATQTNLSFPSLTEDNLHPLEFCLYFNRSPWPYHSRANPWLFAINHWQTGIAPLPYRASQLITD